MTDDRTDKTDLKKKRFVKMTESQNLKKYEETYNSLQAEFQDKFLRHNGNFKTVDDEIVCLNSIGKKIYDLDTELVNEYNKDYVNNIGSELDDLISLERNLAKQVESELSAKNIQKIQAEYTNACYHNDKEAKRRAKDKIITILESQIQALQKSIELLKADDD